MIGNYFAVKKVDIEPKSLKRIKPAQCMHIQFVSKCVFVYMTSMWLKQHREELANELIVWCRWERWSSLISSKTAATMCILWLFEQWNANTLYWLETRDSMSFPMKTRLPMQRGRKKLFDDLWCCTVRIPFWLIAFFSQFELFLCCALPRNKPKLSTIQVVNCIIRQLLMKLWRACEISERFVYA